MLKFEKFLIPVFLFSLAIVLHAQDIICTSQNVYTELSDAGNPLKTVFEGNVRVTIRDIVIECERAIFDHTKNTLEIDQAARFSQKDFSISSEYLSYDFETETGEFIDGRFFYAPFYGRADLVRKETDVIFLDTCILTTCDREQPHYRLSSKKIELTGEKLVIRDLKLYFGSVPVFYFPRYSYNLKTKKPFFVMSVGYKTELGNGISLIFNNTMKGKKIDFQERLDIGLQGLGFGFNAQDSTVSETGYSANKFQSYAFRRYGNYETSYGFNYEFQKEFVNHQNVIVDWRWIKDNKFFRRLLYDLYLEKSANPNYFSYSKPFGEGFFAVRLADSAGEDLLSPSRIPEIEFSFPYVNIGRFPGSFDIVPTRFVDNKGNEYTRIVADARLDMPLSAGYAKIVPFMKLKNVLYLRENDDLNNFVFSPGINIQFLTRKNTGNRVIYFSPSISVFSDFPSKKFSDFSVDSHDSNPDGIFSSLNLVWDFWHDETRTGNITFLNFYDASRTRFSDSILMWNYNLGKRWTFYGQERFNFSKGGMKEMNNTVLFRGKDIEVGLGNSFLTGQFDGISATLNKRQGDWEYGFYLNYDIKKDKFTHQRFYIQKKIHCLIARIMYSKTSTTSIGILIIPSAFASKNL